MSALRPIISRILATVACAISLTLLVLSAAQRVQKAGPVSLAGAWRFELDREDRGFLDEWPKRTLSHRIELPGVLQAQGFGDDVTVDTKWMGQIVDQSYFTAPEYEKYRRPGNIKVPFWLQPDKYYAGAAWYQRDFEIPAEWQGQRIVLTLERPHWQTLVWMDDRIIGSNDSLSTPHVYDLGSALAPGKHRLTVRVDNRLIVDVGINSHSISDHTQGNWNGIVGRIALETTTPVWIDDLQVFPDVARKAARVRGRIGSATGAAGRGKVRLVAELFNTDQPRPVPPLEVDTQWDAGGGVFEAEYPLGGDARLWDEFDPALYGLTATLTEGGDTATVTFGLREIAVDGTQFVINGRKTFFRGTLESAIFPLTGHPPTDVDSWKRIIRIAKSHGLNMIRFHSWCPPEAAFIAADELGFYYQVEAASWANQSTRLGVGLPVDAWIYKETDRILQAYGNHPSIVLMAYGNEPAGRDAEYLAEWINRYRASDPRRLYTAASGWPQIKENQFHVTPDPRIQAWGAGLASRINAKPPETRTDYRDYIGERSVPVISHEIGQWCVYPNFDEIPKYTGYLKPKNFEIFRDRLNERHMGNQARAFLHASGKLQALCYKEDIESALRTPGMGGFQLLDLHDFPGQGTALVGVLDPFWDAKGYVTADEYRRFCNTTVPLARLDRRVFTTQDVLEADVEAAHFGPKPLENTVAEWKFVADGGGVVAGGKLSPRTIALGNGIALGRVRVDLRKLRVPQRYNLVVTLAGTPFENDWDVWVYPPRVDTKAPPAVTIVNSLDESALATLKRGGRVLLLIPPAHVRGDKHGKVAVGFSSIFWNTAWTHRQAPHTLGILCDPKHPALANFPTDAHSNWQWWFLLTRAGAMILDDMPPDLRPIVQAIDDWVTSRRLGLVFEARVGGGRLLVSSIDLNTAMERNPVARQLLFSLLTYLQSDRFDPTIELRPEQVRALAEPVDAGTTRQRP
jgi:hypothetical protein